MKLPTSAYFPDLDLPIRPSRGEVLAHGVPLRAHDLPVMRLKPHLDLHHVVCHVISKSSHSSHLGGDDLAVLEGSLPLPRTQLSKSLRADTFLFLKIESVISSCVLKLGPILEFKYSFAVLDVVGKTDMKK